MEKKAAPSVTQPANATNTVKPSVSSKKKSKKLFWILGIGCLGVIALFTCVIVGGIVAALATNKEIPVFTSVTESLEEKFVDPKKYVKSDFEKGVNKIVSIFEPATDEDGMTPEEFQKAYTEMFANKQNDIDTNNWPSKGEISGTMAMVASDDSTLGGVGNDVEVKFTLDGESKYDKEQKAIATDINAKFKVMGLGMDVGYKTIIANLDSDNPTCYMKMDSGFLSSLWAAEYGDNTMSKWVKYSMDDIDKAFEENKDKYTEEDNLKIDKKYLEKFKDTLLSDEIWNSDGFVTWLEPETIDGVRTRCVRITISKEILEKVLGDLIDEEDMDEMKDFINSITNLYIDVCKDRVSNRVYKMHLVANFDIEDGDVSQVDLDLTYTFSGYGDNQGERVEIPDDSECTTFEEWMKMFDTGDDYDNYYPPIDDYDNYGLDDYNFDDNSTIY